MIVFLECQLINHCNTDPWFLTQMDARFFGKSNPGLSRRQVLEKYCDYVDRRMEERKYGCKSKSNRDNWVADLKFLRLSKRGLLVPIVPLFYGKRESRKFRQQLNQALDADKRARPKNARENWDVSAWDVVEEALRCVSEETLDERPPSNDFFDNC